MSCLDCHDYMDGFNRGKKEGTIEELKKNKDRNWKPKGNQFRFFWRIGLCGKSYRQGVSKTERR